MTGPLQPHIIAEVGGVAVAEHGPLVIVIDRGTGPWATAAFVLGVFAVVSGGFGAVTLVVAAAATAAVPWWVGAISATVGLGFAVAAAGVVRRIRGVKARPVSAYRPVAIFDRARRLLIDADGAVVAPLEEIRFDTRMQVASSSPMLVVMTPVGNRILKRGNPFNGGIGNLEHVLTAAIFGRPPR